MNNISYQSTPVPAGWRSMLAAFLFAVGCTLTGASGLHAQGDPWRPLNATTTGIISITVDSSGDYIGANLATDSTGPLRVSRDHGASWESSGLTIGSNVHALATAPNGHIFAGSSSDGVFRSTDRGATWQPTGPATSYITSIVAAANGTLYAATDQTIYRSSDDGGTWTQSATGLTGQPQVLAVQSTGTVFAGTYEQGLFRSNDGMNWEHLPLAHPVFPTTSPADIAIDRNNGVYVALLEGGVFHSADNGDTWSRLPDVSPGVDVMTLRFTGRGDLYAGTFGKGIWLSTDNGEHWDSTGLPTHAIVALASDPAGFILAGTLIDLYQYTDLPAGVDEPSVAPPALRLAIEPNLIRDGATLSFDLPRRADVRATIVDEAGRTVATLYDGALDAGAHQLRCDVGLTLPPGIYFCAVRAGAMQAAGRMIVVR